MKKFSLKVLLVGMMNIFAYGNAQAVTMSERMNSDIAVQKDSTVKKEPIMVTFSGNVPPTTPGAYKIAYKAIFVSEYGSTDTYMGRGEIVVGEHFSSIYLDSFGRHSFETNDWVSGAIDLLQNAYKGRGVVSITVLFKK